VKVVKGQANLFQVIGALHAPRRFPSRLHCWQQESDQDANDRNHHQQLNQRKSREPRAAPWKMHHN
jgi:hypothetical protein